MGVIKIEILNRDPYVIKLEVKNMKQPVLSINNLIHNSVLYSNFEYIASP